MPWNEIVVASAEQGESFLVAPPSVAVSVLGAVTQLGDQHDLRVYIIRLLDDELAQTLSQRVGPDVRLINYRAFTTAPVDEFTSLHSAGLADGRSAVQRIERRICTPRAFRCSPRPAKRSR